LDAGTGWAVLANVNNVREFRQIANFIDRSLQPMPNQAVARAHNRISHLPLARLLVLAGVGCSSEEGEAAITGFNTNHPIRPRLRRTLMLLIGSALLAGVFSPYRASWRQPVARYSFTSFAMDKAGNAFLRDIL